MSTIEAGRAWPNAERRGDTDTGATPLASPFMEHELFVNGGTSGATERMVAVSSPFTEAFAVGGGAVADGDALEMLIDELFDDEFVDALEAVAQEANARLAGGSPSWSMEVGASVPIVDTTHVEEWMEALIGRTDALLADLEVAFHERSAASILDEEVDRQFALADPDLAPNPLDARELLWGAIKRKVKGAVKGAAKVAKKGISLASKFMPMNVILGRLRPIVDSLLREFLRRAIGKLPRRLRRPARRLARRFGLRVGREVGEVGVDSEAEAFADEFDMELASALVGGDEPVLREADGEAGDLNVAEELDVAREQLVQHLLAAEEGDDPTQAIERFIPVALLPIAKTAITIAGRKRVVDTLAGMITPLIKPVVGRRFAKPLSVQIADQGLRLLKLEAEAELDEGRLAAEAVVSTIEDTVEEVFSLPAELLEDELLVEAVVEEAFGSAVRRYFPASALRSSSPGGGRDDAGVWVMMPRTYGPMRRYQKFSRPTRALVTRAMAREVVFSDGETLEDRIADAGIEEYPVDVEVEAYNTLPGVLEGQIAAFESAGESPTDHLVTDEFDTFEEAGELPLPPGVDRARRGRGGRKRVVRATANGRRLRRRRPVVIRTDLSTGQPLICVDLRLSERLAMAMVGQLKTGRQRDAVKSIRGMLGAPMRRTAASALRRKLARRGIERSTEAAERLTDELFDQTVHAFSTQLGGLTSSLVTAAQDPAPGVTVTATFRFASKEAIGSGPVESPQLSVQAGRRRG